MFLYDKIIVVDVEATCWEKNEKLEGMHHDIIEIGVCKLVVETGEIIDSETFYVIPERSEISDFCTSLTGISKEIIEEKGLGFAEVCKKIKKKYGSDMRAWAAYGEYDKLLMGNQCSDLHVQYPFSDTFLNIKALFIYTKKLQKSPGLMKDLELINITPEGKQHSAKDDAYNAAMLLKWILEEKK
jgi:inhibitor of KinA sporulation pathway (predicted exonuclease)